MDDMLILFVAMGVFTLMLIGLGLTVREFRTNIIVTEERRSGVRQEKPEVVTGKPQLRRVV